MNLRFSPYTYARVCVMRSKLIRKQEYNKLLKMELREITRYLQDHEYKQEIDALGLEYKGIELLEIALNKNLVRTFNKLITISNDTTKVLIQKYLKRMDIQNIKNILRGKYAKLDAESIEKMVLPAGVLTRKQLNSLIRKGDIKHILQNLKIIEYSYLKRGYDFFEKNNNLAMLENLLDRHYYEGLSRFLPELPDKGRLFLQFIELEMDFLNVKNILKFKKLGFASEQIMEFMIPAAKLNEKTLYRLSKCNDAAGVIQQLKTTVYGKLLHNALHKTKDITDIELELNRVLFSKIGFLPNVFPLSIDTILSFMFAKEIEFRNIMVIAKAKQMHMPEEFIVSHIIVG